MQQHSIHSYELIDFGNRRKLERFGNLITSRPCPAAVSEIAHQEAWESAELIYDSYEKKGWTCPNGRLTESTKDWICRHDQLSFLLKPSNMGQVGVFPEHWEHWSWLEQAIHRWNVTSNFESANERQTIKALNLFAYTGATTLKLSSLGATVTHVDAMKSAVDWARSNAGLSGLGAHPLRWIVEDSQRFVSRELRRNNRYDLILFDPPTYGHGPKGEPWEIHKHLTPLLESCCNLLSDSAIGILMTGHSRDIRIQSCLESMNRTRMNELRFACEIAQAKLVSLDGRKLDCGFVARFEILRS